MGRGRNISFILPCGVGGERMSTFGRDFGRLGSGDRYGVKQGDENPDRELSLLNSSRSDVEIRDPLNGGGTDWCLYD